MKTGCFQVLKVLQPRSKKFFSKVTKGRRAPTHIVLQLPCTYFEQQLTKLTNLTYLLQNMTDFCLGAFFRNVFSPKSAPKNSQGFMGWGGWAGVVRDQGLGFRTIKKSYNISHKFITIKSILSFQICPALCRGPGRMQATTA